VTLDALNAGSVLRLNAGCRRRSGSSLLRLFLLVSKRRRARVGISSTAQLERLCVDRKRMTI
jgi:hypothetical protein